jgi:hypothetical protein
MISATSAEIATRRLAVDRNFDGPRPAWAVAMETGSQARLVDRSGLLSAVSLSSAASRYCRHWLHGFDWTCSDHAKEVTVRRSLSHLLLTGSRRSQTSA